VDLARFLLVLCSLLHGGERGFGLWLRSTRSTPSWPAAAYFFGASTSTAISRCSDPPSTFLAEGWRVLLRTLTADSRRHLMINLQPFMPMWRPLRSGSSAVFGDSTPSGYVPGGGEAGRDGRHRCDGRGEGGPDGVFTILFRDLLVALKPLCAFSKFVRGFLVKLITAGI